MMDRFDLIPPDYARRKRFERASKRLVLAMAVIALLVAGARAALESRLVGSRALVAQLEGEGRRRGMEEEQARRLGVALRRVQQQLAALERSAGSDAVPVLLHAVDAAYVSGIWFDELRLLSAEAPQAPPNAKSGGDVATFQTRHLAEILVHATTHGALAEFLARLAGQRGISGVRLLDSALRPGPDRAVIDARVALVVEEERGRATP